MYTDVASVVVYGRKPKPDAKSEPPEAGRIGLTEPVKPVQPLAE